MNRVYITNKLREALAPDVTDKLLELATVRMSRQETRTQCHGPMHIELDGKRYHGFGTINALNDLQFDITSVEALDAPPSKQAAPKKAAKQAPPKSQATKQAAPKKAAKQAPPKSQATKQAAPKKAASKR